MQQQYRIRKNGQFRYVYRKGKGAGAADELDSSALRPYAGWFFCQ